MLCRLLLAASTLALAAGAEAQVFNRIASYPVSENSGADMDTETSPEIISVTEDGMTLVYSDSPLGVIGMVDITDPSAPVGKGTVEMDGEPTAVSVIGTIAFAGVNTSESYTNPSGKMVSIDTATGEITGECVLFGQPDSTAPAKDGSFVAIAIENERDEDAGDGGLPQMPAGALQIVPVADGAMDCDGIITVEMTGLADIAPEDPEPEFVDTNSLGQIAVTLQENNHIVIVNPDGTIANDFSAGAVDLKNIDTKEEGALVFTDSQDGRLREPDAVQWLDDDRIVIANEGDWNGGSRGFTIFNKDGTELYENGTGIEYEAIMAGHYPEDRSGNKGVEPEGMEVGFFGDDTYIFLLLERANLVGVYKDTGGDPEFVQLLPSGIGPEGAYAIPSRNLVVTANEADLGPDGGIRAHVMIYELGDGPAAYPQIKSTMDGDVPIGWGALSGLAADATEDGKLYAISDSYYGMQPAIFTIDATQTPALITDKLVITREGVPAQGIDLEGVFANEDGTFYVASEGRLDRGILHAIYHVADDGEIEETIPFPKEIMAVERRWAAEGVTRIGDTLWVAIQRGFDDDPENQVKLLSYDLESKEWGGVAYPTEPVESGWVGLSDITYAGGDVIYIIERDNQIGGNAKLKALYSVPLSDLEPVALTEELPLVSKTLVHDFIPDLQALNGFVVDKIEGFTIDVEGHAFAATDNDGVDDSSGETLFFKVDMDM
ncbi:esterase-like activity of phytase family protein [Pseudoruegeria sp. HB172150]|uniref:esterase-like activity of phytase family protein n=1 Tax=Pseudoruegeria sp. HB172150 TaxID=2721164 RepID=UPI00155544FC|nr:esterase-like activity of phytase family protein [Pseudoruegeria sp. HB172150]